VGVPHVGVSWRGRTSDGAAGRWLAAIAVLAVRPRLRSSCGLGGVNVGGGTVAPLRTGGPEARGRESTIRLSSSALIARSNPLGTNASERARVFIRRMASSSAFIGARMTRTGARK
jgi:hypothetical protein